MSTCHFKSAKMWSASLAIAFGLAAQAPLVAAPPVDASKSVDEALLDDLDNELLDGIGDVKAPPKKKPSAKPADPPDEEPLAGEDVDWPSAETDPLGYISREMQLVEQLIGERGKASGAEQLQDRIVEDLAKLIEQAEQQQQAQQQSNSQDQQKQQTAKRESVQQPKSPGAASSGQDSNKPASDSSDRLGRAEAARPDPELLRGLMKDAWGHLPEREREQMMQMSPERFLPQYELMIERYYRRLAEERSP
jgi:hypothetical protein